MSRLLELWPIADPLVAGDPLHFRISIDTAADISAWEWAAQVRTYPGGRLVTEFSIEADEEDDHTLVLSLTDEQTTLLRAGYGFSLRQTAPIEMTWLTVQNLNVVAPYTED